jgi:hypothetical protein
MIPRSLLGYPRSASWVGSTAWHVKEQLRAQFVALMDASIEEPLIKDIGF